MTSPPTGVERRMGQRFTFNLPVALRDVASAAEGFGFTQDLSSRGALLFTDMPLSQGAQVELTLRMPSEITLGEAMNVRCRGRVLRLVDAPESAEKNGERRIGVAVCIEGYEHLAEASLGETEDQSAAFRRISALRAESEDSPAPLSPRAIAN
jgi:hypothetical protein